MSFLFEKLKFTVGIHMILILILYCFSHRLDYFKELDLASLLPEKDIPTAT